MIQILVFAVVAVIIIILSLIFVELLCINERACIIIIIVVLFLTGNYLVNETKTYYYDTFDDIRLAIDSQGIHGSFGLGCGYVDTTMYYSLYKREIGGYYTHFYLQPYKTKLYLDLDNNESYLITHNSWNEFWGIKYNFVKLGYELHLPKETIINEYKMDGV